MTENTTPGHESAVPYASAEQLGDLSARLMVWLAVNGAYKLEDGMPSYTFAADGDVVAGLSPDVVRVFPDVKCFELYFRGGSVNPRISNDSLHIRFGMEMRPNSLYSDRNIDLYSLDVTADGRLLVKPHRSFDLAEPLLPSQFMSLEAAVLNAVHADNVSKELGAHEVDVRELDAMNNIVDNLDTIKSLQTS